MMGNRDLVRSAVRIVAALQLALLVSACVADEGPSLSTTSSGASGLQPPRYSTYRCDGDNEITIEDFRTSVHVIDSRGVDVELPAAPPSQTTRYGQPGYALVLEDPKALWMVSGKRPVNCVR
jgi:hypothetical protein